MLTVEDLHTSYGAIKALRGVSFEVPAGQVVTLIGANGAGKSTTLNTLSGLLKPSRGRITFDGRDITGWPPAKVTATGLVQVPEGREVLAPLTVEENLELGAYTRDDAAAVRRDLAATYDRFPRLGERRQQLSGSLSGGEQQMLAIGRALMARPKLLMLDEPSMGLAPLLVKTVFQIIAQIRDEGTTILLVEQNANQALQLADYAYVLDNGTIAHQGPARELRQDPQIVEAYLGSG
jgi:branched-chain amino acid transport system ATP-binding protein